MDAKKSVITITCICYLKLQSNKGVIIYKRIKPLRTSNALSYGEIDLDADDINGGTYLG